MYVEERSFSGKIFLPKTESFLSSNGKLLLAITRWGQEIYSSKALFEELETHYYHLTEDIESTHPFPKLLSLTHIENSMRSSVIQANQNVYNKVNQDSYSTGFELFFASLAQNICTVVQIGYPIILLDRPECSLQEIGQFIDPSLGFAGSSALPPLPAQLLGINQDISFHPFSFRFHNKDRLILTHRHRIPTSWLGTKREERNVKNLSKLAAEDNPQSPFWLALIELTEKDH